jgi:hypothetical protein
VLHKACVYKGRLDGLFWNIFITTAVHSTFTSCVIQLDSTNRNDAAVVAGLASNVASNGASIVYAGAKLLLYKQTGRQANFILFIYLFYLSQATYAHRKLCPNWKRTLQLTRHLFKGHSRVNKLQAVSTTRSKRTSTVRHCVAARRRVWRHRSLVERIRCPESAIVPVDRIPARARTSSGLCQRPSHFPRP